MSDPAGTDFFSRAGRLVTRLYRNECERLAYRRTMRAYAHRSFGKTLDWDWNSIHYNRIALLSALAARNPDGSYLEIGCFRNALFDSLPLPFKVGVDPVQGGTVRATSDEFFATNTQTFDLIFIDGLHTYEQVHRDVANALKVVKPGGWIAMHDMLPRNWIEEHEPVVRAGPWVGGGWKVGFELLETTGIDFRIVKIDYGVGALRVATPGVELADLSKTIGDAHFAYFYDNHARLPLATWEEAWPWLRQP